jgi:hypothetical protein
MNNAQVALEAASRVFTGQNYTYHSRVTDMADHLLRWLDDNEVIEDD